MSQAVESPSVEEHAVEAHAVEEHAKARIVNDAPHYRSVPVALRYEPDKDPDTVHFRFPSGTEWAFRRELLETGLRAPARSGDVTVWPCGRAQVVVELHSPDGVAVIQFDTRPLVRFLRRTYAEVTAPATAA
ncbi:SsgA family sporulation/cell division regulator [Streptomyces sp. NBC_01619]|uniref:SsgA family sporulation/cell division regulator n=1 Tax=Streptomyces pratisoli TaxID=3139917 RepID=A0ACC6QHX3_9ACTN|nr:MULTISPECIES: SsgA family sporulation/cell division regulator [unclassified Streptomyces]MCX4511411.1 SsgA family sporulation/cell division regulator [Streptomyces sp. NBC_01619]